jgi:hypothetical protein
VVLPASECETIAKVRRRAISSVRVLINLLQLLPGCGSLASGPAAPTLAVDMMAAWPFANCYKAVGKFLRSSPASKLRRSRARQFGRLVMMHGGSGI